MHAAVPATDDQNPWLWRHGLGRSSGCHVGTYKPIGQPDHGTGRLLLQYTACPTRTFYRRCLAGAGWEPGRRDENGHAQQTPSIDRQVEDDAAFFVGLSALLEQPLRSAKTTPGSVTDAAEPSRNVARQMLDYERRRLLPSAALSYWGPGCGGPGRPARGLAGGIASTRRAALPLPVREAASQVAAGRSPLLSRSAP